MRIESGIDSASIRPEANPDTPAANVRYTHIIWWRLSIFSIFWFIESAFLAVLLFHAYAAAEARQKKHTIYYE